MKLFRIDSKNRVHVEASRNKAGQHFSSQQEWARIAAELPMSRMVEIWNELPGVTAIRRFTSRQIALTRIWKALQNLESKSPGSGAPEGRTAQVLALLRAEGGVSLEQLVQATGWQKHSIRGFLSGTIRKKLGMKLMSFRDADGARVYRIRD